MSLADRRSSSTASCFTAALGSALSLLPVRTAPSPVLRPACSCICSARLLAALRTPHKAWRSQQDHSNASCFQVHSKQSKRQIEIVAAL